MDHPQKITFAEMRDMGVRGLLIYCADYRCSHSIAILKPPWLIESAESPRGNRNFTTALRHPARVACVFFLLRRALLCRPCRLICATANNSRQRSAP